MRPLLALVDAMGRATTRFFLYLGNYSVLIWTVARRLPIARGYRRNFFQQMVQIGTSSILITVFVAAFVGMVTSVQSAHQFMSWIPRTYVGSLVIKSVLLELTPLITALVLAGKVGATITAELGAMRVTEQIDALDALGFDSISFLITPRVLAGIIMFPTLVVFGDLVAVMGGLFGAVTLSHIASGEFLTGIRMSFHVSDAVFGITKATVFGYAVTSIACFRGYYVEGGSEGVGNATMSTVVLTCLTVVVLDFAIASIVL